MGRLAYAAAAMAALVVSFCAAGSSWAAESDEERLPGEAFSRLLGLPRAGHRAFGRIRHGFGGKADRATRSPRQHPQELRHRPPRCKFCRVGPMRRPIRLQVQSARSGLGARRSPGDEVSWDDAQGVRRVALKDDGKVLSAAHRGGVGICGARRVDDPLLVGKGCRRQDTPSAQNAGGAKTARRAPADSFRPNAFGLYDTAGNAAEWVEDCWNPTYRGAPNDGRPGRTATARFASSAEARSPTRRSRCAPPPVFATMRTSGTTPTAFGWRETWIDGQRAAVEGYVILGCGAQRAGRRQGKPCSRAASRSL